MRRAFVLALTCIVLLSSTADSQTRRRRTVPKSTRHTASTSYAEKQQAEVKSGRERIASQIKTLTQFLYLFGGISKRIESAEMASRNHEDSSIALPVEQIESNKSRVRDSIRGVRMGLDQLEASFRTNPALQLYYPSLAGVGKLGQIAESQAAANSFDLAGRSLLGAVNKLADALVAIH